MPGRFARSDFDALRTRRFMSAYLRSTKTAALARAIDIAYKYQLHSEYLDDFVPISVCGWSEDHRRLAELIQLSCPVSVELGRIRRMRRPDVADVHGPAFRRSGYEINLLLKSDEFVLPDGLHATFRNIRQGLTFSNERDIPINGEPLHEHKPMGYVDSLALRVDLVSNVGLRYWLTLLRTDPECVSTLMEASCDVEAAQVLNTWWPLVRDPTDSEELPHLKLKLLADSPDEQLTNWQRYDIQRPVLVETTRQESYPELTEVSLSRNVEELRVREVHGRVPGLKPGYFKIMNGEIRSNGVILSGDGLQLWDEAASPRLDFVAGTWQKLVGSSARLDECLLHNTVRGTSSAETAIVLTSRVDSNWFHWLIETLPRLLFVSSLADNDIPILISDGLSTQSLDALGLMTDRNLLLQREDESTFVTSAIVPAPVIYHPDTTQLAWRNRSWVNVDVVREMAECIKARLSIEGSVGQRIYVRRGNGARGLLNEEEIERTLVESHGFSAIDPSKLTFAEQVQTFSRASVVVGPGGAMMSNFIFLPRGATAIVLTSKHLSGFTMPGVLAHSAGAKAFAVLGTPVSSSSRTHQEILHSSYSVRTHDVISAVQSLS